jgi:hypothetical protein
VDDVDSYAERLAAEGRQRERGSRGEGEGDGKTGGGSRSGGSPLQEMLQQLIGGEGEVVEFKVLVGDEAIAAATGAADTTGGEGRAPSSTLGGLLESLVSGLGAADGASEAGTDDDEESQGGEV